jgi:transcriptional regulator with XRE-family HTH domain
MATGEYAMVDEPRSFAARLDQLLSSVHPSGRGPYTYDEVADGIKAQGGPTISAQYLNQLHRGRRDNPTKQHLEALARFFGVPVAYFFDDTAAMVIDEEIALLTVIRDAGVKNLALRALELGPEARRSVAAIIEELRQFEGRSHHSSRRRRTEPGVDE